MPGFAERLAYVRWIAAMGQQDPESDRALAQRAGIGEDWLRKWMRREDAPTDRTMTRLLCAALNAPESWLLDAEGEPPEPTLWSLWQRRVRTNAKPARQPKESAQPTRRARGGR